MTHSAYGLGYRSTESSGEAMSQAWQSIKVMTWAQRAFYVLITILFIKIWTIPFGAVLNDVGEEIDQRKVLVEEVYQARRPADLETEMRTLNEEIFLSATKNPEWYFDTLARIVIVGKMIERGDYVAEGVLLDSDVVEELHQSLINSLNAFQPSIERKFGLGAMHQARNIFLDPIHGYTENATGAGSSASPKGLFLQAYLWSATLAAFFFLFELLRKGLRVFVELPRLGVVSFLWFLIPFPWFKYPANVTRSTQWKDSMRLIGSILSISVSVFGAQAANAKTTTKNTKNKAETEIIDEDAATQPIALIEGPGSDILPMVKFADGTTLRVHGWGFATCDSAANDSCGVRHGKIRGIVQRGQAELFFQGNLNENFRVDTLALRYRLDSGIRLQIGRIFMPAADGVPAPFAQETISDDGLPAAFLATGVGVDGTVKDWSFAAALTGKSGARLLSDDHFDRLDFSANVKRTIPNGHVRFSFQQAGDARFIADFGQTYGPHEFRGAIHYRTAEEQIGGYLLYQYTDRRYLQPFARIGRTDEDWLGVVGMNVPANDNLDFTGEVRSDGTYGIKARARF